MSTSPDEFNPYLASATVNPVRPQNPLPGFCKTVFIIELIFCCLRVPAVLLGFVGASMIEPDDPLAKTVLFELVSGVGIIAFGIPGNIGLLMKKGWGVPLGYLVLVATLGSIGTGVMQISVQMEQFAEGTPERVGAMMGGGLVCLIRLGLMGLYFAALTRFSAWLKEQPA